MADDVRIAELSIKDCTPDLLKHYDRQLEYDLSEARAHAQLYELFFKKTGRY